MDQNFNDITAKDTVKKKSILKLIFNIFFSIIILFAIFSIIITIINIKKISNNEKGYFIHHTTIQQENNYTITTSYYLCYKIVKIDNKSDSTTSFRFWFMKDIDY